MTLGDIENKQVLTARQAWKVAANVAIAAGKLVYQDGTNGMKVVPTTAQPIANRIWFLEKAVDNTAVGNSYGAVVGEVFKRDAEVVGTADGAITVDSYVRASANVAGAFQALAVPADLTGGEAPTEAEHIALLAFNRAAVGIYERHLGEAKSVTGAQKTDAADTETNIVVRML